MAPKQEYLLHINLRRDRRRAYARYIRAIKGLQDAMRLVQSTASDMSVIYDHYSMRDAQKRANFVVNALRDPRLYTIDRLDLVDEIGQMFSVLPEE